MKRKVSNRGFASITLTTEHEPTDSIRIKESSHIGGYGDAVDNPGSSGLWIRTDEDYEDGPILMNREEVQDLVDVLQNWLENKRL